MGHASIVQTRGYIDVNINDLEIALRGLDRVLKNVSAGDATEEVWAQNGHTSDFPLREKITVNLVFVSKFLLCLRKIWCGRQESNLRPSDS